MKLAIATFRVVSSMIGLVTIIICAFFITGYALDSPGYYTVPIGSTPISLPTCILCLLLGTAVFILSKRGMVENSDHATLMRLEGLVQDMQKSMNGRLDLLIKTTAQLSELKGRDAERLRVKKKVTK